MCEVRVDPDYGVYASIDLIIDSSTTSDVDSSVEDFEEIFDDWSVISECNIQTKFLRIH